MLEREHTYKGRSFKVICNAIPIRRFRWRFEGHSIAGNGVTDRGLEAAFVAGRVAAEEAIDA